MLLGLTIIFRFDYYWRIRREKLACEENKYGFNYSINVDLGGEEYEKKHFKCFAICNSILFQCIFGGLNETTCNTN